MSIRDLIPWNWGTSEKPVRKEEPEDPFLALQHRVNRLFDDFWQDFGIGPFREDGLSGFRPRLDIAEKDKEVEIRAELPGMKEDDIDVSLSRGVLNIRGEKKSESEEDKDGTHYRECSYGSFHRQIPVPEGISEDDVKAEFKDGVLTLTLPRKEPKKTEAKKIKVLSQ